MTIIICGSRYWQSRAVIRQALKTLPSDTVVVHGDCRGADRIGALVARQMGLAVRAYPADWKRHGKAAGPIRNAQMLREGKPDRVLAFHNHINESLGTRDMVDRARKAGVPVDVYKEE